MSLRESARLDSLLFSDGTSCPGSLSLASSSLLRYFACSGSSFALVVVFIFRVLTLFRNGLTGTALCGEDEFRSHGEDCLFSDFVTVIARKQWLVVNCWVGRSLSFLGLFMFQDMGSSIICCLQ